MGRFTLAVLTWNRASRPRLRRLPIPAACSLPCQVWFKTKKYFKSYLIGNPTSSMVTFTLFVKPALKLLTGQKPHSIMIQARMSDDIHLDPRPEYHRCILGNLYFVNFKIIFLKLRFYRPNRSSNSKIDRLSMLGQYRQLLKGKRADHCPPARDWQW